ncbi:major facilitator superfamily domain-containing protein [Talaromyces proteolyticus]|uniref:Major facilitator superfamily domain-containing protein n=1 Tax=Talaromyces proteolyticus TaxID=1131652 RepID=A0AAD4KR12_9EURO|nr:major facilitator superfamily domain-containing protein [Talaromyces proteolyticus]KAH8697400.1 major facilitator superfamily domain-containing protein [Talaromyces proteolyticus]
MTSLGSKLRFLTVAGIGFFSDGYLNLAIGLVVPILGYLYFENDKNTVPTVDSDVIKGCLSLGMIVGQLAFGTLGDAWGRHTIYGKELILTMFGTLMVVLLPWKNFTPTAVTAWVSVFRVVTGFGIGADYPMSGSLSAEKSPFGSRAKQVLTVFSNIGLGNCTASVVFLVLLKAFEGSVATSERHLEWVWRLLLGLGIIPAALTLYARLTMAETIPYQKYVSNSAAGHKRGLKEQWKDFRIYFSEWKHAKVLFATAASWFLFDIAFYGINLNQSVVLSKIGYAKGATHWETLYKTAVGNLIVQCAGYLPGFYVGIFLPDKIGRVRQQFYSCLTVCILYAIWAGISSPGVHTSTAGLMVIFAISQFVLNVGPNCTTFLIPAEVFPTRVRGMSHGISAAAGKCGAVLTAFAFGSVQNAIGLDGVLGLFSGVMLLTALVTLLIPETKGRTLEDIENDIIYAKPLSNGGDSSGGSVTKVNASTKTADDV